MRPVTNELKEEYIVSERFFSCFSSKIAEEAYWGAFLLHSVEIGRNFDANYPSNFKRRWEEEKGARKPEC